MHKSNEINYYVEPVEIEIYLKKSGKVRTIIKDMYIELIDVVPTTESAKKIFEYFMEKGSPIDLIEIMNAFPEYLTVIYDSYYQHMELFEKLSMHFQSAMGGSRDSLRLSLYFTELLIKYEPTIASTRYIGDFATYNINYLIRKLNEIGENFAGGFNRGVSHQTPQQVMNKPEPEFDKLVELWQYNLRKIFINPGRDSSILYTCAGETPA